MVGIRGGFGRQFGVLCACGALAALLSSCAELWPSAVTFAPATNFGAGDEPSLVSPAESLIRSTWTAVLGCRAAAPTGYGRSRVACPAQAPGTSTSNSYLDTTSLAPNLLLQNTQFNVFVGGILPGCWFPGSPAGCDVFPGDKGIAIGQTIDSSAATVSADPNAKTVQISGAVIKNNATSSTTLNGLFPNAGAASAAFTAGDKFGISILAVSVR